MKFLTTCLLLLTMSLAANADVHVKLSADSTLTLRTAFTKASVGKLKRQARAMDANLKSDYPIKLVLYTPGGSIQAGLELYDFLAGLNRPVITITLFAASMGFQTVQHLGTRYITRYGVLMSHKARGGFSGEFGDGESQLDSRYGMWLRRIALMDQKTVERTNGKQTLKSYRDAYSPELWLNGAEAVEQGYADDVAIVSCDVSLDGTDDEVFDLGFVRIVAKMSKCPTMTAPVSIYAQILTNQGVKTTQEFLEEGGKFGKKCRTKTVKGVKDFYGNDLPDKEPELCALDQELTLEKINKLITEKENFINRDLRKNVIYSY